MDRMNEEQAVFKQLILSDWKKWNSPAFKTFNNYTILTPNNRNMSVVFLSLLLIFELISSCSGELHVIYKHFQKS